MSIKNLLALLVTLFSLLPVFAQENEAAASPVLKDRTFKEPVDYFVVGPVKTNLQTKVVVLPKPDYPIEAKQSGAEGVVKVLVSLDEGGAVMGTQILSGDPLLASACESAASRSQFRKTRDASGTAIKTNGVLEYSFEIEKSGWVRIAHGLILLDRQPVSSFLIPPARKALGKDWTIEHEMLDSLDAIRRNAPKKNISDRPTVVKVQESGESNGSYRSVTAKVVMPPRQRISAEQASISLDLINAIRERLKSDSLATWQFDVGLKVNEAMIADRDPGDISNSSQMIRSLIEKAPSNVSPESIAALRRLETAFTKDRNSQDTWDEIRRALMLVLSIK